MKIDKFQLNIIKRCINNIVIPYSPAQEQWCKENIEPQRDDLQRVIELIREDVDRELLAQHLQEDPNRAYPPGQRMTYNYPEGHCGDIRNGVYDRLKKEVCISTEPVMQAIQAGKEKGIMIHAVYGILNGQGGRCFQNAIQIGTLLVDCAFDTGEFPARKVVISPLETMFTGLESYVEEARVAQTYNHTPVYSLAECLPFIAPFLPAIKLQQGNAPWVNYEESLFFLNIMQNFRPAEEFIGNKEFTEKRLPPKIKAHLRKIVKGRKDMFQYREGETDLSSLFAHCRKMRERVQDGKTPLREKASYMRQVCRIAQNARYINGELYRNFN